ncbi:MAG TPA: hypothetical protein PK617_02930 [Candidatus Cloacimonas sp.]|nr:hypothetical protein [Candidatus Cloacimonas sp.]
MEKNAANIGLRTMGLFGKVAFANRISSNNCPTRHFFSRPIGVSATRDLQQMRKMLTK